jgi:hypothetical protein
MAKVVILSDYFVGLSLMNKQEEPVFELQKRKIEGREEVFDPVRKKYVALTPEEWVRQYFLQYLIGLKNFPPSLLAVETSIKYNKLSKRCDIVAFSRKGKPLLIVECKAPEVEIDQDVFQQIAMYNFTLKVRYLVVTNGSTSYICLVDHETGVISFLQELPDFDTMNR